MRTLLPQYAGLPLVPLRLPKGSSLVGVLSFLPASPVFLTEGRDDAAAPPDKTAVGDAPWHGPENAATKEKKRHSEEYHEVKKVYSQRGLVLCWAYRPYSLCQERERELHSRESHTNEG